MSGRVRELRRAAWRTRQTGRRLRDRAGMASRRREHLARTPSGQLRVEVGSGGHPTPGYFHVDVSWQARHLEALAPMWKLPLPDDCAAEVRAIHALEHVEPRLLLGTLREWRRVLVRGGVAHISVPNGPAISEALRTASVPDKWPLIGSLLGMYCNPQSRAPEDLVARSDHQIVFDPELLTWALSEAGFGEIVNRTDEEDDRHSVAWRGLVERYSLIMRATA
jgi:hypothetical protein